MNDIDLSSFSYGGMNVTGFRIVDVTNQTVKKFLIDWEKVDGKMWHGAGSKKISVSMPSIVDIISCIYVKMSLYICIIDFIMRKTAHRQEYGIQINTEIFRQRLLADKGFSIKIASSIC